jgi:hypothetical protein
LEERVGAGGLGHHYADALAHGLSTLPTDSARFDFIDLAASVIAQLDKANLIASELMKRESIPAQELALAALATGIVSCSQDLVDAVLPVLERPEIHEGFRESAVRAMLPNLPQPLGENILLAFVRPFPDKLVGIDRLRHGGGHS